MCYYKYNKNFISMFLEVVIHTYITIGNTLRYKLLGYVIYINGIHIFSSSIL